MSIKQDIQNWWTKHPMTYSDFHGQSEFIGTQYEIGTFRFFERLDQEFYSWNKPLHDRRPFDRLFPYDQYPPGTRVLEIGCGLGTMAMNWALQGVDITAVDLSPFAVEQTKKRFELYGLKGEVRLEDANQLSFRDGKFDYAYSWGVLHHSPNLEKSISEMMRVTKSGGGFGIMLYNRRSLMHWYMTEYIEGFLHYESRFLKPLELASRYGDGAREEGNPYTWPVTSKEIRRLVGPFSRDMKIRILGTELDGLFRLLLPGLGLILPTWAKKVWSRQFGWSLWAYGHKRMG
jgi:ubiquinone/menaquinone biosynthesis C-methylase UbiE